MTTPKAITQWPRADQSQRQHPSAKITPEAEAEGVRENHGPKSSRPTMLAADILLRCLDQSAPVPPSRPTAVIKPAPCQRESTRVPTTVSASANAAPGPAPPLGMQPHAYEEPTFEAPPGRFRDTEMWLAAGLAEKDLQQNLQQGLPLPWPRGFS